MRGRERRVQVSRRGFIKGSAAGLAAGLVSAPSLGRVLGANERISVGIVGPGQRGTTLLGEFNSFSGEANAQMTAVCDIWTENLERASGRIKEWTGAEPQRFREYEGMLARDDIDAVIIATADFQHAKMLTQAMIAGKDVYCEKPMANVLEEAKEAVRVWKDTKRIVQIGTQYRSDGQYAAAAEFVQSGALGTISKIDIQWNYFGARWRRPDLVKAVKVEDTVWEKFLMGKPWRPFDPHLYVEFRLYRDFSSGIPDQWMAHSIDKVHWMMDDHFPKSAVAHGGVYVWKDGRENEDTFHGLLEYPKGFLVSFATRFGNKYNNGADEIIYGTKGIFLPREGIARGEGGGHDQLNQEIKLEPKPSVPHMKNWLDCLRSRKTPNATVWNGYAHSVACILVARSIVTGGRLYWDPDREEIYGAS